MNKLIAIGDIHGIQSWKLIVDQNRDASTVVFVGDYFDTHDGFTAAEQIKNFNDIAEYARTSANKVVLLLGNHDYHYITGDNGTSGYQVGAAPSISHALSNHRDLLQMAYAHDNILFSHAGVGETWMELCVRHSGEALSMPSYTAEEVAKFVNDVWESKPREFMFNGRNPYGDDQCQTPIWIRQQSLMRDAVKLNKAGIIQVFGHTQQKNIKDIGGYWCIDALASGQYLIIDKDFSVGKI